jgi:hypothetical protein
MIPWIVFAVIAVPLVVVGFIATRRNTAASERPASNDANANARTEHEFAEAEAFEAKWHEEDHERFTRNAFPSRGSLGPLEQRHREEEPPLLAQTRREQLA